MCRLLAALCARPRAMRHALVSAPRSLRALSTEHKHGWGIATHTDDRWSLSVGTPPAHEDPCFERASDAETHAWIAHVRLATVGSVRPENTHPFLRDRWCFAHNGTIRDLDYLRGSVSRERDSEREGSTDSERFFAYLLTRLDAVDRTRRSADARTDNAVIDAVREATDRADFGALNFVLSDGETLYFHRLGRTLSVHADDSCFIAASEPWSDDPFWTDVPERALVRVELDANRSVRARTLREA